MIQAVDTIRDLRRIHYSWKHNPNDQCINLNDRDLTPPTKLPLGSYGGLGGFTGSGNSWSSAAMQNSIKPSSAAWDSISLLLTDPKGWRDFPLEEEHGKTDQVYR